MARAGTAAQRATWLPGLVSGQRIVSLAHTEADARHDLAHVHTSAMAKGGRWVLSGRKSGVLGAPWADGFVVAARTSGTVSECRGISLFLVEAQTPGVQVAGYKVYEGSRAGDLQLDAVVLGPDALLGMEGESLGLLEHLVDLGIVGIVDFSSEHIQVPKHVVVKTVDVVSTIQELFFQTNNIR